jgi:integrase
VACCRDHLWPHCEAVVPDQLPFGLLSWSEIDLDAKTITLPATRTKNHTEHVVPLCETAIAILKDMPRREGHDHVLGKYGYSSWSGSKRELNFRYKYQRGMDDPRYTPHGSHRLGPL